MKKKWTSEHFIFDIKFYLYITIYSSNCNFRATEKHRLIRVSNIVYKNELFSNFTSPVIICRNSFYWTWNPVTYSQTMNRMSFCCHLPNQTISSKCVLQMFLWFFFEISGNSCENLPTNTNNKLWKWKATDRNSVSWPFFCGEAEETY